MQDINLAGGFSPASGQLEVRGLCRTSTAISETAPEGRPVLTKCFSFIWLYNDLCADVTWSFRADCRQFLESAPETLRRAPRCSELSEIGLDATFWGLLERRGMQFVSNVGISKQLIRTVGATSAMLQASKCCENCPETARSEASTELSVTALRDFGDATVRSLRAKSRRGSSELHDSFHHLEVARLPTPVEGGFGRAIEPEDCEISLARHRRKPVGFFTLGCF